MRFQIFSLFVLSTPPLPPGDSSSDDVISASEAAPLCRAPELNQRNIGYSSSEHQVESKVSKYSFQNDTK